jgi:hypothetical protein
VLFRAWEDLHPWSVTSDQLKDISDFLWQKNSYKPTAQQMYIDFRELEHVYQLFQLFFELEDAAGAAELESNLPALMRTLKFYTE